MPTYVYACNTCGAQFEQFQRFSDEPLDTCPRCQGAVRRVFQPVGIVFKGGGWYITDSRKSSSASPTNASSAPAAESAAPAESTPESKPESKPAEQPATKPAESAPAAA